MAQIQTRRWHSIQMLRGIAVLAVVAFHSLSIEKKYAGGDLLLPSWLEIGQSGVDLFFVISGFVMVAVTRGRFASRGEVSRFLWHRISRIYPTYWFYFFLTLSIFIVKPTWVNASQGNDASLISSFFLFPSQQLPLVMVAWSLVHEVWFYIVFAAILRFSESALPRWLLAWIAIVIGANLFMTSFASSPVLRIALHPLSLEFIAGAGVALMIYDRKQPVLSSRSCYLLILVVLFVGIPLAYAGAIFRDDGLPRTVCFGLLYGTLVLAMTMLEKHKPDHLPHGLVWLGNVSYTVYLSHILVLSAIGRLWAVAGPRPDSMLDNALAFLIMWLAVAIYGWLGYSWIEKPLSRQFLRWSKH